MSRLGWFLLNSLQAIFTGVWSAVWITLAGVMTVLTFSREIALVMARKIWGPGLIWGGTATMELVPGAQVDYSRPHIFVMNHQSMLDVPVAFACIPVNLRFVAKRVLKYVPFLGQYMQMTGMIFVDRGNRAQAVESLRQAGERIRAGANIIAFPEGTRSRDGSILPFKKGIFHVAIAAQVPIVPVVAESTGKVLPRDGFRIRPGVVRFKIGEPIATAGLTEKDRDALMKRVRDAMIDLHVSIGGKGGDKSSAIAAAGQEGVGRPIALHPRDEPQETARPDRKAV